MVKKVIILLIAIIMAIGVGGCMSKTKKLTNEKRKEMVLEHLKEKYGEEFVGGSWRPRELMQPYDVFHVYPKEGGTKDIFDVYGWMLEDGTYKIRDGYFGVLIKDEYEAAIRSFVSEVYGEFVMYTTFGSGVFPEELNKDTKLIEIWDSIPEESMEYFSSHNWIFIKYTGDVDVNDALKKIAKKMAEKKLVGNVTIYEVFEDKYEMLIQFEPEKILDEMDYIAPLSEWNKYFEHHPAKDITVFSDLRIGEVE